MFEKLRTRAGLLLGAAVLLVVVFILLSYRKPLPRVAAVRVTRDNISATVTSNGKVEPITPYQLRAQFDTFVEKVVAREGQNVKPGQLILTLDASDARAKLALAREQLLSAEEALRTARAGGSPDERAKLEADLRKAELERDRLSSEHQALARLVEKKAATPDELERNDLALGRAEAEWQRLQKTKQDFHRRVQVELERATLLVARDRDEVRVWDEKVRSATLTSPIDGTVYSRPVRAGDFVKVGDLLAAVADLRQVRVRAFIDEPDLGMLAPDQQVEITWDAHPNQKWWGRTEQIPKEVVARGPRSVGEVLCSISNEKLELIPNVNVDVHIFVRARQDVLVVPRGAVYIEGTHHYVYVIEGGLLERSRLLKREIKVGIGSATNFEVLQGLREDEMVALPGAVELRDAMTVRVVRTG